MPASLALSAWLRVLDGGRRPAAARRAVPGSVSPLWVHVADPELAAAQLPLSLRLSDALGEPVSIVLTRAGAKDGAEAPPAEKSRQVDAFLDAVQPAAALWLGLDLRPALAHGVHRRGIPQIMVASDSRNSLGRHGHVLSRPILGLFDDLMAATPGGAMALRRLSARGRKVELIGPLETSPPPPEADEGEISRLHALTQVRPVWLARTVTAADAPLVIEAHRMAVSQSHRLLLIAVAADHAATAALKSASETAGLLVAMEAEGQDPTPRTQVYLPETDENPGTWYRLASIAYLGDTLPADGSGSDPEPATSFGSALVYGPHCGRWAQRMDFLAKRGAARRVTSARELGEAVTDLLAPERAAAMAHAAWTESSAGAAGTERLAERLTQLIEERG